MNLMTRLRNYKTSRMRQEKVLTRGWFIFRWEILIVVALGLLAALLNQIPNWVTKPDKVTGIVDPIFGYPLRDNIVYSSISMFLTIGIAIFIGVFSEIGKFAGKYGSALFVLVPSFVWLMSDRSDSQIVHVLETAKLLGTIIFWSMAAIAVIFAIATILKEIAASLALAHRTKLQIEFAYNFLNRFLVVLINVLIVLMLGYGFINFGVFSLHLADNTPDVANALDAFGKANGPYDLHSESFTIYIAIIAVSFALIMVLIGLATSFVSKEEKEINLEREEKYLTKEIELKAAIELKRLKEERYERERKGY